MTSWSRKDDNETQGTEKEVLLKESNMTISQWHWKVWAITYALF